MGTMEGYLLGQALASDYDTGPAWKARAMREKARADDARETALEWKAEAERLEAKTKQLEAALNKEHKRLLVERRQRRNYMRGWAVRGQILRELVEAGRYTSEEWNADADRIERERNEEYLQMRDEADQKVEQEVEAQS